MFSILRTVSQISYHDRVIKVKRFGCYGTGTFWTCLTSRNMFERTWLEWQEVKIV